MAKGQYLGDVYVLQDMTDEVKIDRAKTSFIGTISHELRTPITTLLGTTDLMARGMFGRMEDRQTSEVKIMHGKLAHMTRLINNVIVIADIDAGTLPFDMEPLSAQELVEEATWKMQKEIKEKGLSLSIDIPDDLPPVIADYDHAQTIIRQIVDNARRYTMTGSITIRAARENEFVRFDIIDTGPGIAPDMREQVFERFVRGMGKGQGVDSQERGLGLGLAIVKQLVARQGGHVWVTNATGEGSIFSFTLRHTDVMGTTEKQDEAFGTAA
jgi:signal transduction histidine kinase